jgi:hypothetical protein
MKITGKSWEFRGCASRPGGYDITNSYIVGPLLPVSRAFPGVLVCLHYQTGKLRMGALAALQQKCVEKPGYDTPVFCYSGGAAGAGGGALIESRVNVPGIENAPGSDPRGGGAYSSISSSVQHSFTKSGK